MKFASRRAISCNELAASLLALLLLVASVLASAEAPSEQHTSCHDTSEIGRAHV